MNFRKLLLIYSLILISYQLQAQSFSEEQLAYDHMYQVNKEWQHFPTACSKASISFESEDKRIAFHLEQVIDYLSMNTKGDLNPEQLEHRQQLLTKLGAYAKQAIFPKNSYHKERQPYFIDHLGTHCAVGFMIKESGHGDLAQQISLEHNYDYLPAIKTAGVAKWAQNHGFELEELAWIQPGYPPNIDPFEQIDGVGGRITKMETYDGKIAIAGVFSELDSMPCLNIGYYENEHYTCLDGGIEGSILDMKVDAYNNRILVSGALFENGIRYPLAIFDLNTWSWSYEAIPGRSGAIGITTFAEGDAQSTIQELVIKHSTFQGNELWSWTGSHWVKKITTTGDILEIEQIASQMYYGGHFDSLLIHRLDALDRMYYSQNVICQQQNGYFIDEMVPVGILGLITDSVLTITGSLDGTAVYFAGISNKPSDPCISVYDGNQVNTLIDWVEVNPAYSNGINAVVNSLKMTEGGLLLIGGAFRYSNGQFFPTIGRNMIWYNTQEEDVYPFRGPPAIINSIVLLDHEIYIGGFFDALTSYGYLGKFENLTPIDKIQEEAPFKAYPNPTNQGIMVEVGDKYQDVAIEVTNSLGQLIKQEKHIGAHQIQLDLAEEPGIYLVRVRTEKSEQVLKIIKK